MKQNGYKVFVSHGTDDAWVASQVAKRVRDLGAEAFLDQTNIPKGANFKVLIHNELTTSHELIALFTPWSAKRSWVWIEIGAAWVQGKPVVAVFYGMGVDDLQDSGQGKGVLEDINVLPLNDIEQYFGQLENRISGASNA